MTSTVGSKFRSLQTARRAEHVALLGHCEKMGDSFRFIAVLVEAILMLANLMQISELNVF